MPNIFHLGNGTLESKRSCNQPWCRLRTQVIHLFHDTFPAVSRTIYQRDILRAADNSVSMSASNPSIVSLNAEGLVLWCPPQIHTNPPRQGRQRKQTQLVRVWRSCLKVNGRCSRIMWLGSIDVHGSFVASKDRPTRRLYVGRQLSYVMPT